MAKQRLKLKIKGSQTLGGSISAPPSKAYTHRFMVAASLSQDESIIENPLLCDDTIATMRAILSLGASIKADDDRLYIQGSWEPRTPRGIVDCGASGTTLRFMTAVFSLAKGRTVLTGDASLQRRPMEPLLKALGELGIRCRSLRGDGYAPIEVLGGTLRGGRASIVGDVSSQFISGLLLALPKASEASVLNVTTELESESYVKMTMKVLGRHGVRIKASRNLRRFSIPGNQCYSGIHERVPGDFSSSAFLLSAAAITGSRIEVRGLDLGSLQADMAILEFLKEMGALIEKGDGFVRVNGIEGGPFLRSIRADVRNCPDLAPVMAVLGCFAKGRTIIEGMGRLRFKESDRIRTIQELAKMGAHIEELEDRLIIHGPAELKGAIIDSYGDHRIAMACAMAALGAKGLTVIDGIECIRKSYPSFLQDLRSLGVEFLVEQ
ncbi:3-phosphoshikimate 1-carboxyvinyltransferase [Candidatus Bathyarchaeota archaeon]|nr:3-phosphoshikimate 1-carboxyvinyltransferase [Candidatus Bathyarchaeota archaeon]